jgi:hypothetical protein
MLSNSILDRYYDQNRIVALAEAVNSPKEASKEIQSAPGVWYVRHSIWSHVPVIVVGLAAVAMPLPGNLEIKK